METLCRACSACLRHCVAETRGYNCLWRLVESLFPVVAVVSRSDVQIDARRFCILICFPGLFLRRECSISFSTLSPALFRVVSSTLSCSFRLLSPPLSHCHFSPAASPALSFCFSGAMFSHASPVVFHLVSHWFPS